MDSLEFARLLKTAHLSFAGSTVAIGRPEELARLGETESRTDPLGDLKKAVLSLGPWRKGPFNLFGLHLQAYWDAGVRFSRALGLGDQGPARSGLSSGQGSLSRWPAFLAGADVADVGCNNGYYLYRLLEHGVRSATGLDPVAQFEKQFRFLEGLCPAPAIQFRLAGFETLRSFSERFDAIFLMGVLYHHRDPFEILRICRHSLRPGGWLFLETMAVPESLVGSPPLVMVPGSRYLGMKGVWSLPNRAGLAQFLTRAQFRKIEISHEYHGFADQQRTEFAPLPPPGDFLDSSRPGHTREGLPVPVRLHAWAQR